MAGVREKLPESVAGELYVGRQCIDCDVCRESALANFTRNDENGYSYVSKRPISAEEAALCEETLTVCSVVGSVTTATREVFAKC